MKVIYSNNNICICGNCGCTLQYEMSDIRTKSECFNKGYTNDQYYDINYIHCPYCGRDNEVGWNIRTERSPFMRSRYLIGIIFLNGLKKLQNVFETYK